MTVEHFINVPALILSLKSGKKASAGVPWVVEEGEIVSGV